MLIRLQQPYPKTPNFQVVNWAREVRHELLPFSGGAGGRRVGGRWVSVVSHELLNGTYDLGNQTRGNFAMTMHFFVLLNDPCLCVVIEDVLV